jgi:hypothetical protein
MEKGKIYCDMATSLSFELAKARTALADLVAAAEPFDKAAKLYSTKHDYVKIETGIKRVHVSNLRKTLNRAKAITEGEAE